MSFWKLAIILVLFSAAVETGYTWVYHSMATGPLAAAITEHTVTLENSAIPPADDIDIYNDPWVKVAHFESSFYQVQTLVDMLFGLLLAAVILLGGMSAAIAKKARALSPNIHLQRALYLIFFSTLYAAIYVPYSFSSHVISNVRGTSYATVDMTIFAFFQDFFLGIIFTLIPFIPLYWIMDRFSKAWWAIGAAFFSAYMIFTAFVSPVLIDPLYYDVTPLPEGEVKAALTDIVATAGVPSDRIFVADVSHYTFESNAFVAGIGATKRIILDNTLLTFYTPDEIRAIVAHELGHYVLHHIWLDMIVYTALSFVSFFALFHILRFILRRYGQRIGATRVNDIVLFPLLSTLMFLIPTLIAPIESAISRSFERAADAYEVRMTGDPQASIDGFKKMSYQSFIDVDPPAFLQFWFGTHPTTKERIEFYESQK